MRTLDTMSAAREIGPDHRHAAARWRRDWLVGVERVDDPDRVRTGQAADRHAAMLARVAASARCQAVGRVLGRQAEQRLRLLLIDELSFSDMARVLLPSDVNGRKKIAAQTALLLEILASYYAAAGDTTSR